MGKRRQRMWPPCQCGEATSIAEHMPACGRARCLRRWWTIVGLPSLLLLAGIVAAGLMLGPGGDQAACPEGWRDKGAGVCVRG